MRLQQHDAFLIPIGIMHHPSLFFFIILTIVVQIEQSTAFGYLPSYTYRQQRIFAKNNPHFSSVNHHNDNVICTTDNNTQSPFNKKKTNSMHKLSDSEQSRITISPEQVEEQLKVALAALQQVSREDDTSFAKLPPFPSVRDCNAALAAFGDAGDLLRALRLFGKMRKVAACTNRTMIVPTPTLVTYSTLMSRAIKFSKPLVALRLWDLMIQKRSPGAIPMEDIDVKAANIRMNCFAKLADVSQAQNLLQQMITGDGPDVPRLPPNIVTYNTLLHACQRAGDLDAALAVVRHMHHCRPDARTYTSLMATVARQKSASAGRNDPSLAFVLLDEMKSRGIRPNGITYSALIDVCGRCRRPDLALRGLRIMLLQKAQEAESLSKMKGNNNNKAIYTLPDEVGAWTAAINACGKAGRIQTAMRLFRAMPGFGVIPNTITCGSLTDSLLRAGATAETLDVLRYMKKNGIVPSEVMYTSLMTRAERLAKMERDGKSFSTAAQAHVVALDSQPSEDQPIGDARAIDVYTELIKSLVEGGRRTKDLAPRNNTLLVEANTARGDDVLVKVFLVFQEMKTSGTMPDLACYNALLRACARAADIDHANDVLRQMLAADLCPNDTSWRQLLQAAAQQKNGERALQAWKQGVEYSKERRRKRPFMDEPNVLTWKPSASSLAALLSALLAEAKEPSISSEKRIALYRKVVELYDKVLLGDEKMGFDRLDLDDVLENQRVVILFIRGMLGLSELEDDPACLESQRLAVRSILELECLNKRDDTYRLPWAVRETLNKAVAFSRTISPVHANTREY
jgi:pentatricopeptide repeat protein